MDENALREFFRRLDRSFFIDGPVKECASLDAPLPIGHGQTISQPTLVFEMTCLLSPEKDSRVLEVGTGSGYQTALLAEFSKEVYTVERIGELAEKAKARLNSLGYRNVFFKIGDGSEGWPEKAPFDRIIVTAAAGRLPDELVRQLGRGGRMIVPVGGPDLQVLKQIDIDENGEVHVKDLELVRFVEFVGRYGWAEQD